GSDGPAPAGWPTPAGAFVDGTTWDRIGEDAAELAIVRCDAGTVLAAIDALVVTGPTGINHADVAIVG
ncbi:MAG TPA: MOFRL family protein, partial [Kofleriaceae bacterium]